jgi:hypothetical protein
MSEAFVIHSHLFESSKLALDQIMGYCNSKTTDLDGKLVSVEKLVEQCRVALDNELFYNEFVERLTDKTSDAYKAAKKALDDERKKGETKVRRTFGMQNLSLKHMLALIVFMTMGFMAIRANNATVRPRVDLRSEEADDVQILDRAPGNFVSLDGTNAPVYQALDLSQYERRPAQNRFDLRLRLETLGGGADDEVNHEVLVAMYAVRWLRLHQKKGGNKSCSILDEMEAFVKRENTIEQFFAWGGYNEESATESEEDSEEAELEEDSDSTAKDSEEEEAEEDSDSDSFDTAKDSEEEEAEEDSDSDSFDTAKDSEVEETEEEEQEEEEEKKEEVEEEEEEEEEESEQEEEANAGQRIVERLRAAKNAPRQQTEPNKSDALEKIRERLKNKGPFLKKSPASKARCACRTKQNKRCKNKAVSSATQFCRLHQNCKDFELQGGGEKEMYTLYSTLYEKFRKQVQNIKVTTTYLPGIFGPLKHFFESEDKIADFPAQFKSMQRLRKAAARPGLGNFTAYAEAQRNEFIKHKKTLVELDKWFDAAVSLLSKKKGINTSRFLFRPLMLCVAWARFLASTNEEDTDIEQGEALRKEINKALENERHFEKPSEYFEDGEVYYEMAQQQKKTKNKKRKRNGEENGAGPSRKKTKEVVIDLT